MDAFDPAVWAETYFLIVMARMMLSESSAKASVAFLSQKIQVQMLFVCQARYQLVRVHALPMALADHGVERGGGEFDQRISSAARAAAGGGLAS